MNCSPIVSMDFLKSCGKRWEGAGVVDRAERELVVVWRYPSSGRSATTLSLPSRPDLEDHLGLPAVEWPGPSHRSWIFCCTAWMYHANGKSVTFNVRGPEPGMSPDAGAERGGGGGAAAVAAGGGPPRAASAGGSGRARRRSAAPCRRDAAARACGSAACGRATPTEASLRGAQVVATAVSRDGSSRAGLAARQLGRGRLRRCRRCLDARRRRHASWGPDGRDARGRGSRRTVFGWRTLQTRPPMHHGHEERRMGDRRHQRSGATGSRNRPRAGPRWRPREEPRSSSPSRSQRSRAGSVTMPSRSMPARRTRSIVSTTAP